MLVEFRVKNFLSIQDEQVLSLVANSEKEHENTNTFQISDNLKLLKSSTIYGPNAAGKSNFIKALFRMQEIIQKSAKTQRNVKFPIEPFLLGNNENEPTEFEITIFVKETQTRYQYGFSTTQEKIYEEWLFACPNTTNRTQKWFSRIYNEKKDDYDYEFGNKFTGEKKLWQTSTRDNALFLSTAIQLNSKQLRPIFDWFDKLKVSVNGSFYDGQFLTAIMFKEMMHKSILLNLFEVADFDIKDILIEDKDISAKDLPSNIPDNLKEMLLQDFADKKFIDIKFLHQKQNSNETISFDIKSESDGTQHFFSLIGPFVDILKNGGILIIDELHNHLHPLMTKFLIELFHNSKMNTKNAQLIFTTHETSILKQDIFRRDQIWFCEKENKATILYPLSDFYKPRRETNLESAYLLGKYGALPYFKDICMAMENGNES